MTIKIIGAILVLLGCGSFGFAIAGNVRYEIICLRRLITALEFMECDLNYRRTPLAQLFRLTAAVSSGCVKKIFLYIATELEHQNHPNAENCVASAVRKCPELPKITKQQISELGKTIGTFDLPGQTKSIRAINAENKRLLEQISSNQETRIRSYKTLGICAGAALVILFI